MSTSDKPSEKPSIVVDSDWKAQVEAEKEALRQQQSSQAASAEPAAADEPSQQPFDQRQASPEQAQPAASASAADGQLPPASFSMLVMTLASQALATLGMAPGPDGQAGQPQLPLAKHFIDTLGMLEEKTQGNLDAEEARLLGEALAQLRLAYVSAKKGK